MPEPSGWIPVSNAPAGWTPVQEMPSQPDSSTGVLPYALTGLATAGGMRFGTRPLANAVLNLASYPNAEAIGSKVGQAIGGITALPAGLSGLGDVHKAVWAGGRAGWFTTKLAQRLAGPVAEGLEAVAPYVEAASTPLAVISGGAALAAPFLDDPTFQAMLKQHASAASDAYQKTNSYWEALKGYFTGQATLQNLSDASK